MNEAQPRTLGRYRLVSLLGEGGMGKVYRGFDSALERNIAIKLLPPELVNDASRLTRFTQEARAASALNHPNVVTVFDIGEERLDGETAAVRYIAMELIEGKTLRELLGSERVDLRRGLKIAIQVAEGLAAAHAAGIIHRDLKPENIMVTQSGLAKVLDFGLAKLRIREESQGGSDSSRTIAKASEPGTVMGTVGYMSPEQAQGRPVDARSDIFALGCVLYEIASGRRAFQGDSSVDTLHKIIYNEPAPLREIRNDVPPELARIVRKALAKDPDDRYQSVKDVAIDLRDLLREIDSNPSGLSAPAIAASGPGKRRGWLLSVLAIGAVIIAAGIVMLMRRRAPEPVKSVNDSIRVSRVTANGKVIEAYLSPDAKFTAYVVSDQGQQTLVVREMASGQTLTLIPPRRGAYWGMAFSPDSSSIYFAIKDNDEPAGSMYQISTIGGQPRKLLDAVDSQPAFSPDGKRMVFLRAAFPSRDESALMIANADGSGVRTLASVRSPEFFTPIFFAGASWSPDGKTIAAALINNDNRGESLQTGTARRLARVVGVDVASGSIRTIAEHGWPIVAQVAWMPDQKGLVATAIANGTRNSQVWYIPYPSGEPQPITRDLFDYRIVSLSADGKSLVTVASDVTSDVWIVRDAEKPRHVSGSKAEGIYGVVPLPDGRIVTTSVETGKLALFVMNQDGTGRSQVTHDENTNRSPAVTPDGNWLVYLSTTPKGSEICRIALDGSGRKVLASASNPTSWIDVAPDGKTVIYDDLFPGSSGANGKFGDVFGLSRVSIDGGTPQRVGSDGLGAPAISPDGSTLAALHRDSSGRFFLSALPLAGTPVTDVMPWAISNYSHVQWSADGKSLVVNTVEDDRANLWAISLDGKTRKKLTNFDERNIFAFARLRDGKGWVLSRGELSRDAVMITGFRPPS